MRRKKRGKEPPVNLVFSTRRGKTRARKKGERVISLLGGKKKKKGGSRGGLPAGGKKGGRGEKGEGTSTSLLHFSEGRGRTGGDIACFRRGGKKGSLTLYIFSLSHFWGRRGENVKSTRVEAGGRGDRGGGKRDACSLFR